MIAQTATAVRTRWRGLPPDGLESRLSWPGGALVEGCHMQFEHDDKGRMVARHEMVMKLIDNNARQLRCDNQRHGIEIERQLAARAAAVSDPQRALVEAVERCDQRLAAIDEEERRLTAERDWLTEALAAFDAAAAKPDPKEGFDG
jgi:hypothetical protein